MDLLTKLLEKEPSNRLVDPVTIKQHPFFNDIDWDSLTNTNFGQNREL